MQFTMGIIFSKKKTLEVEYEQYIQEVQRKTSGDIWKE